MNDLEYTQNSSGNEIAIVGYSGKFPGAKNVEELWQKLCDGKELITFFSDEELIMAGIDPAIIQNPNYVKARGMLEDICLFDAAFFGYSSEEARSIDPQQRMFLECAWQALENAGYYADNYKGVIGVYAGVGTNRYHIPAIGDNRYANSSREQWENLNGKDFLSTRVSYKLNLRGPSVTIQTACSTSLVAVHMACQSLISYECDMALAGGVYVEANQQRGYWYNKGGLLSPDGHCKVFDAKAQGMVMGNGLGIVVLKRLSDALSERDTIHAIIKGSAINNDGAAKASYTALSIQGQAEVITTALTLANVSAETIQYIETGNGTLLGDLAEVTALTRVFRERTNKNFFCALGSVRTNIGHLDTAAGIAGLLKTVLAIKHKQIPPSLHFHEPHSQSPLTSGPFYVNTNLAPWVAGGAPRRAAVSSFGIGGTNAHVILEEAPDETNHELTLPRSWQLLLLSAKTELALEMMTQNLHEHLKLHPDLSLADVAYTLQVGRKPFPYRKAFICQDRDSALQALEGNNPEYSFEAVMKTSQSSIVFLFPGEGTQYVNMASALYREEPYFRSLVDHCAELLKGQLKLDFRTILYPTSDFIYEMDQKIGQAWLTLPILFVTEYALAQLWISWGVRPHAMIGSGIGEYVAACLAGVFSLQEALFLIATIGQLLHHIPERRFVSIPLSKAALLPTLETSSQTAKALLQTIEQYIYTIHLQVPTIRCIASTTGTWLTNAEAINPSYWLQQLYQTARLDEGVQTLGKERTHLFLEVGPGHAFGDLVMCQKLENNPFAVLSSLNETNERETSIASIVATIGRLWLAGVQIDWFVFSTDAQRYRLPLPTYPFERQCYWIDQVHTASFPYKRSKKEQKGIFDTNWFYAPTWKSSVLLQPFPYEDAPLHKRQWLVFNNEFDISDAIIATLQQKGDKVVTVQMGEKFTHVQENKYVINCQQQEDYDKLFENLRLQGNVPQKILHFWSKFPTADEKLEKAQSYGLSSLLSIVQILGSLKNIQPVCIYVISNNMHHFANETVSYPEKATILSLCRGISQHYPSINCSSIDIDVPPVGTWQERKLCQFLLGEVTNQSNEHVVAYRANTRWVQIMQPIQLDTDTALNKRTIRENSPYLIIHATSEMNLLIAEYLSQNFRAKLILVEYYPFPSIDLWSTWLNTHGGEDKISQKIRKMQAIEKSGTELLFFSINNTTEHIQRVVKQAYEKFGIIHGVIYGRSSEDNQHLYPAQKGVPAQFQSLFLSNAAVLLGLEKSLQRETLDFCILQSSLASVLTSLECITDAAISNFMDAFAHQQSQTSAIPWVSINWDGWGFEGETREDYSEVTVQTERMNAIQKLMSILQKILYIGPQIIIC